MIIINIFSIFQVNATNKYFQIFKDITDDSVLKNNVKYFFATRRYDITVQRLAR